MADSAKLDFLRMQHSLYERAAKMAAKSENAIGLGAAYHLACLRDAAKEILDEAEQT